MKPFMRRVAFGDILRTALEIELDASTAPPIFRMFRVNNSFDDMMVEHTLTVSPAQIDLPYISVREDRNILDLFQKSPPPAEVESLSDEHVEFKARFKEAFDRLPPMIRKMDPERRYKYNNVLSICFLHGQIVHPVEGIASPHLKGFFHAATRRSNTGFLALGNSGGPLTEEEREECATLLNWLKENNPLYEDVPDTQQQFVEFVTNISEVQRPQSEPVAGVVVDNNDHALIDNSARRNVRIQYKDGDTSRSIYVPLESALCLMFPLLFPYGNLETIPGSTMRAKSKFILTLHPLLRCGRLGCFLLLYLYNIISYEDTAFYNRQVVIQRIEMPRGVERDFSEMDARPDDPAFPEYWKRKETEVMAMIESYGDPDLMMTLTFNNGWEEIQGITESIAHEFDSPRTHYELKVCPVETMRIWKNHFDALSSKSFSDITTKMGLGKTEHFVWRLEFQARGAPHAHILLWLENPMHEAEIAKHFFAVKPPEMCPELRRTVLKNMVHACYTQRCRRGDPANKCKYGFPKPESDSTYFDNASGKVVYARGAEDQYVVEYSPVLIMNWKGHAHIHILKTAESGGASEKLIHYITKYNFKAEPNMMVTTGLGDEPSQTYTFSGRVVSSEEAAARIFSYRNVGHNVTILYITTAPPEERNAAFVGGRQVQMDKVTMYYHRPLELERVGILEFFSKYIVTPAPGPSVGPSEEMRPQVHRPPGTLAEGSRWEESELRNTEFNEGPMLPCVALPHAKRLRCRLLVKPRIITTQKFSFNYSKESFAFHYLLLSGCWRSDEEIKAGQRTWVEALQYHGLAVPEGPEDLVVSPLFVRSLITSNRYMVAEIQYILSRLISQGVSSDLILSSLDDIAQHHEDERIEVIKNGVREYMEHLDEMERPITDLGDRGANSPRDYIHCDFNEEELRQASEELREAAPYIRANSDQNMIFEEIKHGFAAGRQTLMFIQGKAGTGKSFLIRYIENYLTTKGIPFAVCASTGIAASLIDGLTVHSLFSINSTHSPPFSGVSISSRRGFAISEIRLLIIDEVTMINRETLELVDTKLKQLSRARRRQSDFELPFGGCSVLLLGDMAQVPAVTRNADDLQEARNQFNNIACWDFFTKVQLRNVVRQSPDQVNFLRLLDRIRDIREDERLEQEYVDMLRTRFAGIPTIDEDIANADSFVGMDSPSGMVVCYKNDEADYYNKYVLRMRVSGDQSSITVIRASYFTSARDSFVAGEENPIGGQQALYRTTISSPSDVRIFESMFVRRKFKNPCTVPYILELCIGARVMLMKNIDQKKKLVNGMRGSVVELIESEEGSIEGVRVKFDGIETDEVIVKTEVYNLPITRGKTIKMYQFPLKLCWACTAHKSQGQTLERVAISIRDPAFAHGSFYVALSRVRRFEDIILFGVPEWPEGGPRFHMNEFIQREAAGETEASMQF